MIAQFVDTELDPRQQGLGRVALRQRESRVGRVSRAFLVTVMLLLRDRDVD